MQYWGKLLGVIVAIWSGAGFWGVVLGLIIGHMIDTARSNKRSRGFFTDQQTRQTLFFRTTFQVMGHLTKSKDASPRRISRSPACSWIACSCTAKRALRRNRRSARANRASSAA